MIRPSLTLVSFAMLAAIVGGQQPRTLNPQQRGELYKKNRVVIERLVEKTVESSNAPNDSLKRANSYYKVLYEFNREIRDARSAGDEPRVAELTQHLKILLDDGLTPTLLKARQQVEGGTGDEEYQKVKDELLSQFNDLLGIVSDKKSLEQARDRLNEITGPKKK